jgi:hypothetical protein
MFSASQYSDNGTNSIMKFEPWRFYNSGAVSVLDDTQFSLPSLYKPTRYQIM